MPALNTMLVEYEPANHLVDDKPPTTIPIVPPIPVFPEQFAQDCPEKQVMTYC